MAFCWSDFLHLGKALLDDPPESLCEASQRTCVSRAYFAAFCSIRQYASTRCFQPQRNADDHKRLRVFLAENLKLIQMANKLDRLRQWRNNCDYDSVVRNPKELAFYALKQARQMISNGV